MPIVNRSNTLIDMGERIIIYGRVNDQTTALRTPRYSSLMLASLLLAAPALSEPVASDLADIGRVLFFDTNLSANRTQSCASCHAPAAAFTDERDNGTGGAVSLGDDGVSLGDRNAPTLTYASTVPTFGVDAAGEIAGGLFYDGRASTLSAQAAEPFTNPLEMALPDNATVISRVRENPSHVASLQSAFGESVFDTTESAMHAITESIAAFERSEELAPFDSRYDRFLRGEIELTRQEEIGRKLFYSRVWNCHSCHTIDEREMTERELFTNNRYHNIGVPVNEVVRAANGLGPDHRDPGLLGNPRIEDVSTEGKYRVPTLRNVAVTGPYMHNGVFQDLETVIVFYNQFILSNPESQVNPETGEAWREPEVPETIDFDLLEASQPIAPLQLPALVAFLEALTDRQYEHLLTKRDN